MIKIIVLLFCGSAARADSQDCSFCHPSRLNEFGFAGYTPFLKQFASDTARGAEIHEAIFEETDSKTASSDDEHTVIRAYAQGVDNEFYEKLAGTEKLEAPGLRRDSYNDYYLEYGSKRNAPIVAAVGRQSGPYEVSGELRIPKMMDVYGKAERLPDGFYITSDTDIHLFRKSFANGAEVVGLSRASFRAIYSQDTLQGSFSPGAGAAFEIPVTESRNLKVGFTGGPDVLLYPQLFPGKPKLGENFFGKAELVFD